MPDDLVGPAMPDTDDDALLKAVGDELKRLRKARKWSRPDFVRRLPGNVPVNTYACYEQGIRPCPLIRLIEICDALGVSVGYVIDRARRQLTACGNQRPTNPDEELHARLVGIEGTLARLVDGQAQLLTLTQRELRLLQFD
jgi:transcriptional regulator with XRE-family HTH domain